MEHRTGCHQLNHRVLTHNNNVSEPWYPALPGGVDELIVYKEAPGTSYEDYSSVDLVPRVMEITGGEGVKAVIDGIGLATWETSIEVLARRGIFVSFGNASVGLLEPLFTRVILHRSKHGSN
jgi:NADPH:quinone reductase-like Zn-dependent oxidoreductase